MPPPVGLQTVARGAASGLSFAAAKSAASTAASRAGTASLRPSAQGKASGKAGALSHTARSFHAAAAVADAPPAPQVAVAPSV